MRLERPAAPATSPASRAPAGSATARGESARATREAARPARQDRLRRGPSEEREPGLIAVERERCGARVPAREVHLDAVEVEDPALGDAERSEEHTSELQSQSNLVCRLLLEKKKSTGQELCGMIYNQ